MEETKLTVRVPRDLVEQAKRYANKHDTTLTRLVEEFLRQLHSEDDHLADAPTVRRLLGILPAEASLRDYHEHMERKHGQ
jgi:hypothetical protein